MTVSSVWPARPIPTLQSIDVMEKVIYINTFSKSLAPAFRISYLVLPKHLVTRFYETLGFYSGTVSCLEQMTLARSSLRDILKNTSTGCATTTGHFGTSSCWPCGSPLWRAG